ncbi:MAG: type II toxin-antitoxin system VapC family toxin [Frankiaceae bacterium]|nr:type II toxin-antitoxin system VapC family toxin [Frankiaceae bacterium]
MILVDTSVWIDHLRTADLTLTDLLGRDEVACHPLVIQELALGSIKNRAVVLASLGRLRQCPSLSHDEVLTLVSSRGLWGKGLSAVDVHLLGSALLSAGTQLWTRDNGLRASARSLGVVPVVWH